MNNVCACLGSISQSDGLVGGLAAGRQKGVGDQTLPPQHQKTYNFYSLMHICTWQIDCK